MTVKFGLYVNAKRSWWYKKGTFKKGIFEQDGAWRIRTDEGIGNVCEEPDLVVEIKMTWTPESTVKKIECP